MSKIQGTVDAIHIVSRSHAILMGRRQQLIYVINDELNFTTNEPVHSAGSLYLNITSGIGSITINKFFQAGLLYYSEDGQWTELIPQQGIQIYNMATETNSFGAIGLKISKTATVQGGIMIANADGTLVPLPKGTPLQKLQIKEDGTTLEYTDSYTNRNKLETDTSGQPKVRDYSIDHTIEGEIDPYSLTQSSFVTLDIRNANNQVPTVDPATTISIEIFNHLDERLVGGAWRYDANKNISSDLVDATATLTNNYNSNTAALNINNDPVNLTGWSDISSYFANSTFNIVTHKLTLAWDKRLFAIANNLAFGAGDNVPRGKAQYTILVSIQEGSNMSTTRINFKPVIYDAGIAYSFHHRADNSSDPVMLYTLGHELILGDPTTSSAGHANLLGRQGVIDPTNAEMVDGQGKQINACMNFTNVDWDRTRAKVNINWTYNVRPFIISAPEAWYTAQSGNTKLWLLEPNDSYDDDILIKNFDIESIDYDPFSGDTVNPIFASGCFDWFDDSNGRATIWATDQQNEMYAMTYDGTSYSRVSVAPWTLDGHRIVSLYMTDANTMLVISKSGSAAAISFELYEYNAGSRYEQASWNRSLLSVSGQYSAGMWDNGEVVLGKPVFYTLDHVRGIPVKFEYDGTNYIKTIGSAIHSILSDTSIYLGEAQSVDRVFSQDIAFKTIYAHGRLTFNRRGYVSGLFADNGLLNTTYNQLPWRKRNNVEPRYESTIIY